MQFRKRGLAIVSLSPTGFFAFEAAIDNTLWVGLISVILLLLATEQTWMNNLKQRNTQSESYFTDISSDIQLRPSNDDKLRVARFPTHLFKRYATLRTMTKFWKKWVIRGITRNIIFRQNTNIALVNKNSSKLICCRRRGSFWLNSKKRGTLREVPSEIRKRGPRG